MTGSEANEKGNLRHIANQGRERTPLRADRDIIDLKTARSGVRSLPKKKRLVSWF